MHGITYAVGHFFVSMGGVGLLFLGILADSILLLPVGNDLLLIVLAADHPDRLLYYVLMATAGSVLGVWPAHFLSRRGADALKSNKRSRRMAFVEHKVEKYGGLALTIAALAPPPFPFTAFIVGAAALRYPLKRMLIIIGVCRAVRYFIEAKLATIYGRQIIDMTQSPWFEGAVIGLFAFAMAGSVFSIVKWYRRGRSKPTN